MISNSGTPALPLELTSFVGRVRELGAVRALIQRQDVRLVTLTGPGGVGKTRLALQVAATFGSTFSDGVRFIPLATVNDPAAVLSRIVQALDIAEIIGQSLIDRVADALRDRQLLLVLDNFEQILDAAPLVGTLLAACPMLRILITSRAPLHISGEHEFPVSPLAIPDSASPLDANTLMQYPATRLFIERAWAVNPDFTVTADAAPDVAGICTRLDGLPLAIELAAARVKVLTPSALLTRLDHSLTVLTGGMRDAPLRQQTLRATIEWSYSLLEPGEQILFNRMAAFAGGGTLQAIAVICNTEGDLPFTVLDGITSLVDKSVVQRNEESGGGPRFGMLETIREYALEQLKERGEHESIACVHAAYYLSLAEEAEPQLIGPEQGAWLTRLEREHDNLRAALGWALRRGETETGLRLGAALWRFWDVRGYRSEGREWLGMALSGGGDEAGSAALRARALQGAGLLAGEQGDYAAARALHEESLALRRELGDKLGIAHCLSNLGLVATAQNDYAAARALNEESLALKRELGDKRGISNSLSNLGVVAFQQGDYAAARARHEESLVLRRELGDKGGIAVSLHLLGIVANRQGDFAAAQALHEQSLVLRQEIGDKGGIAHSHAQLGIVANRQGDAVRARSHFTQSLPLAMAVGAERIATACLEGFAQIAAGQGDDSRAVRLWAVAATLGTPMWPAQHMMHEWSSAAVRARLDHVRWASAWAEGSAMSIEQAVAYACQAPVPQDPALASPPAAYPAGLSPREVEVLRLVAAGHTSRQIADALSLSPRTIDVHLRNIFAKTGTENRAGATAFAFRHGLA